MNEVLVLNAPNRHDKKVITSTVTVNETCLYKK